MESSQGHGDGEAKRETLAGAGSCQFCHLTVGGAIAIAALTLIAGLLLSFILFVILTAAPEASQTSRQELLEQLQQCQKQQRDVNLMLHTVTQDSRCSLCPEKWLWWMGRCYFFSVGLQENRQWNESAEFCRQHNSSLVVIEDSAEMDFIQGVMRNFSQVPFLWVGLTDAKQEGQWLWGDGRAVQHYMQVMVEWDSDHRDCADLRGGASLFAADCEEYGPWACKKEY
ncbi:natural killer cells antigen CD94 isoform X1 [Haplochromis burtoni]|uniref:natural killer cells antigen CD94 isoform X1 n=1 Tax=Haplochromis burtoni TaxID=8153 RepID=UPI0003BC9AEE|nr:natural killer cells antigen CD94 isoform X1 [Haplochromis burtoni]